MTDPQKYIITNFSLCDVLSSHILLGAHHKTGSMLLLYQLSQRVIGPYLKSECPSKKHQIFKSHYHLDADAIDKWLKSKNTENGHFVILNIIRAPLDTVLSAYNYHRRGPELWTRVSLHTIPSLKCKYHEQRENLCSSKLFIQRTASMGISSNILIQKLYTEILTVSQGIEFEFERFHQCCFDEIYSSFARIEELKRNGISGYGSNRFHWNHFENLKLEDFAIDFESACNHLMDTLGILDKNDREVSLGEMKRFDVHSESFVIEEEE